MADIRATKNGNWSDATVWTPNPPAAGDIVRPNNFTVTVDVSFSVSEIRNDLGGGATAGGSFTLTDGVVATASNGFFGTYAGASIGLLNYGGAGSVTLNGNLDGSRSAVTDTCCVSNNSSGTIIINGNLTSAGAGSTSQTVRNQSTGRFIITGNLTSIGGTLVRNNAGTTTINGNIASNSGTAIANTSGTVTITGNLTTNSGTAITNTSGTITITGTLTGTGPITCISQSSSGVINVIGDLIASSVVNSNIQYIINNVVSGTVNVTGNLTGGSVVSSGGVSISACIINQGTGTINVTGTVTNGTGQIGSTVNAFLQAIRNVGTGTINIIGNCVGTIAASSLHQSAALVNVGTGTCNITGNAIGGSTGNAIQNISTATVNLNGNAIGGSAYFAIEGVNAAGNTIIEKSVYSSNGQSPTAGFIKFKNSNPQVEILNVANNKITLFDVNQVSGLMPSISNVRFGVTYSNNTLTGTLVVPNPNNVLQGVSTDNTVGTLLMTPADFWNYLIVTGFTAGSIGERLKETATTDIVGNIVASYNV